MSRPPSRTQVERRSGTEQALLAAAAELVAERGVGRASMASIGERAGTSRGLPNHRFGSKEVLVAQLAARSQELLNAAVEAAIGRTGQTSADLSGLELVVAVADTYLERFEHPTPHDRALIVMWGETFPSQGGSGGMVEADHRGLGGWSGMVEKGQRDGSIRDDVAAATCAVLLQGMVRGVAALLMTQPRGAARSDVRRAATAAITSYLRSPAALT